MNRTAQSDISKRLRTAGVWSKKGLGQHFLVDSNALDVIMETAQVQITDTVVEVGPGLGVLTERLLAAAGRVVAFEYDPEMVAILLKDFPGLELIGGDVLRTAPAALPGLAPYKLVANIPYQITAPLLRLFLEGECPPESLTLLVQKEVAERLTAPAGHSARRYLSVLSEYFSEASYVSTVRA